MTDSELPADLQLFLMDYVASYEQLEALLWLRRHPNEVRSAESIAENLRMAETAAEEALDALCSRQLVTAQLGAKPPAFRYGPLGAEQAALIDRLAAAYDENRLAVMRLMTANAIARMRAGALSTFADSFILKRPKKPNG